MLHEDFARLLELMVTKQEDGLDQNQKSELAYLIDCYLKDFNFDYTVH